MDSQNLYEALNYVTPSRESRQHYAKLLLDNPKLIPEILSVLFKIDDPVSCRAGWILESMCGKNLEAIIPHLDLFTEKMSLVYLDSAVRPIAKICEYLALAYYGKQPNEIKNVLSQIHKERIIEVCFDYMINDERIAPKAYSMNSLYLLGLEFDWVHPELGNILTREFHSQSPGYKARAKKILKKIKAP